MSLNLHAAVRGVIPAVNADTPGWWYQNKGAIVAADGTQTASYGTPVSAPMQVQPPSGRDLRYAEYLQMQGIIRTVWMFSNPGGINRVNQLGNDLLLFPQWPSAPNDVWMVEIPDETWGVPAGGWTKVLAVLQTDRAYSLLDSNGLLVLDSNGQIVRTQ